LWSDEPGCDLAHLEGKRIRGLGSDYPRMLEAAGATPVSLTPPEMYEAMDRGTVDMISIAQQHIDAFDLYDVIDYACGPIFINGAGHSTTMNLDTWESLPDDLQQLVDDTADEVQDWWYDYVLQTEQDLRGELEDAGITFQ